MLRSSLLSLFLLASLTAAPAALAEEPTVPESAESGSTSWRTETDEGYRWDAPAATYLDPATASFELYGPASRPSVRVTPRQPGAWDLFAAFEAADGDALAAGQTYEVDGSGDGPTLRIGPGGCTPTSGRFTVHQVDVDADGMVQRLSVTFAQWCGDDPRAVRGSITVDADDPPAAVPASQARPAVSLSLSAPRRVTAGSRSTVVVRSSPAAPGAPVELFADPDPVTGEGVRQRLGAAELSADGTARFTVRVPAHLHLTASYRPGAYDTVSAQARIGAVAVVDARMYRPDRRDRGVAVYTRRRATIVGPVQPTAEGECARVRLVVGTGSQEQRSRSLCRPVIDGYIAFFFPRSRALIGVPQRARIVFSGGRLSSGASSPWRRFRFEQD